MEENTPNNTQTGRVMDVAPATPPSVKIPVDSSPEEPMAASSPIPEAAAPRGEIESEQAPAPVDDSAPISEEPQADHPELPPKTHKAPIIAVFVAMAICLALTGLVVFTYIKSKNSTKTGTTSSSNSKTTVEKPQASPDDIDTTNKDVDEALSSINDDADFSSAVLSDQALGL